MQKISTIKGTRDFLPNDMEKRNYIFSTIQNVFRLYGFQQIETPAIENLSTLLGKYGEEGEKLLFKVINSGDCFSNTKTFKKVKQENLGKGLKYDLTVPFARFVVMHQHEIKFPFKRFQIQPVWRADKPQNGRYREFFQCDADIIGSNSLLNELELIQIIDEVFFKLQIKVLIKLNHRKILNGIAEIIGEKNRIVEITTILDKIDKIGIQQVNEALLKMGLSNQSINKLQPILLLKGSNQNKIIALKTILNTSTQGQIGLKEIETIFSKLQFIPIHNTIKLDLTLVRGLHYYTGSIFEVQCTDMPIWSISGGGRYDNLLDIFGGPNLSGVGISFGAERIFDVMNKLQLYPHKNTIHPYILFVNFGENEVNNLLPFVFEIRKNGIYTEIYPDNIKIKKQLSYANSHKIPWVAMSGSREILNNKITIKNMGSGEQLSIFKNELIDFILQFSLKNKVK